jgi:site-specific recombinase XerD
MDRAPLGQVQVRSQSGGACQPHICRRTFASRLLERGVDIYTMSKLLGHSSVKVRIFEQAISVLSGGPLLVSSSSGC